MLILRTQFQPGQWLDVFLPGLPKPGGFTITSPPSLATASPARLDLAVQKSPMNPAAAWLWQEQSQIINREIQVRVGGSFVWPPPCPTEKAQHVLFVAGGVGINPLISMVKHFVATDNWPKRVTFLYASKVTQGSDGTEEILFQSDLEDAVKASNGKMTLRLFLTGEVEETERSSTSSFQWRRISETDLVEAIGGDEEHTVCYVCGVPTMTDGFVQFLSSRDGIRAERVLCEKWW
jgi:NAD(P)H-flavin reductase